LQQHWLQGHLCTCFSISANHELSCFNARYYLLKQPAAGFGCIAENKIIFCLQFTVLQADAFGNSSALKAHERTGRRQHADRL
jgi:hypothetical protein